MSLFSEEELSPPQSETLEYRVLARKYRPTTFSQVIGQDILVRLLRNGLAQGRLGHGFIFTGIRGVGKTTTARLLARILNCLKEPDPSSLLDPCGVCSSCQALAVDRHLDVIEIDAASHTGVDDIREIIESTRYRAVSGRYKIFIIDEVHMLSKSAFNALLKTLEEPPAHVKFIFATTEIRRVPATILSRCLRFDLKRVSVETLASHLATICIQEKVMFEPEALTLIARAGDGSVRDALSLLDQAIVMAEGEKGLFHIKKADVQKMLGLSDRQPFKVLFKALVAPPNLEEALEQVRLLYQAGVDPSVVVEELLQLAHHLSLVKAAPTLSLDEALLTDDKAFLQELAGDLSLAQLGRFWQMLLKGAEEVAQASLPLQALEMVCLRLIHVSQFPPPELLLKHLIGEGGAPALSEPVSVSAPSSSPAQVQAQAQASSWPFESFEGLIAFVGSKREALLQTQLCQDVHLVHFEWGHVRLRLAGTAPAHLSTRLKTFLTQETGTPWTVHVTSEEGQPTLTQQEAQKQTLLAKAVAQDPLIQQAQGLFPGMAFQRLESPSPSPSPAKGEKNEPV